MNRPTVLTADDNSVRYLLFVDGASAAVNAYLADANGEASAFAGQFVSMRTAVPYLRSKANSTVIRPAIWR